MVSRIILTNGNCEEVKRREAGNEEKSTRQTSSHSKEAGHEESKGSDEQNEHDNIPAS